MRRNIIILIFIGAFLFFYFAITAKLTQQPSRVYLKSNVLILERRLKNGSLDKPKPYVIMGTTWNPATKAPVTGPNPSDPKETVDYGYFFDWPGRKPQGHEVFNYWIKDQYRQHFKDDITLMRQMNVATIRVYSDFGDDPKVYNAILDELYKNDIMVIVTLNITKDDIIVHSGKSSGINISDNAYLFKVVDNYKHHPAVLMWSIGNEWNFNRYYGNVTNMAAAVKLTDIIARKIKTRDRFHPVSSCVGDAIVIDTADPCKPEEAAGVAYILKHCPNIDIWGINVYRGTSFHGIFGQWKSMSEKPFYISEFGTDSFNTDSFVKFKPDNPCDYRITQCIGNVDEDLQASANVGLLREIETYLAALKPDQLCQGGLVHEFNDELWKVGSYHTGLGDLSDYKSGEHSFDEYNCEGISIGASHPDHVANEEYFGLVDAERRPKKAFDDLKEEFKKIAQKESGI